MFKNISIRHITVLLLTAAAGLLVGVLTPINSDSQAQTSTKVFELRVYKASPGNLANLHSRFRDHTTRIFEKHGMSVVAYWTPTDPEQAQDTLIYVLSHASQAAADASWAAFGQDPEWRTVAEASNANGNILAGVERTYMTATDFSPLK